MPHPRRYITLLAKEYITPWMIWGLFGMLNFILTPLFLETWWQLNDPIPKQSLEMLFEVLNMKQVSKSLALKLQYFNFLYVAVNIDRLVVRILSAYNGAWPEHIPYVT